MQARPVLARSAGPAPMAWCPGAAPLAPSAAPGCPMEAPGMGTMPGTASTIPRGPVDRVVTTPKNKELYLHHTILWFN